MNPRLRRAVILPLLVGCMVSGLAAVRAAADAGYVGPSYAGSVSAPSGEKPQHKLWFHAGSWWGHLYSPAALSYRIFRLDAASASWVDTGISTDTRSSTKADVLWDGSHLVIVSHTWSKSSSTQTNGTRLFRLRWDAASHRFLPDIGYPVTVAHLKAEAVSIDRDASGRLWAAWTAGGTVQLASSLGSDASWSAPFTLPVPHTVTSDDIAAVIAFGNQVGVMWSDQQADLFGFATHPASAAPASSWTGEIAHQSPNGSDDHLNLKTDAGGNVYAAVKTSQTSSSQVLTAVLRRSPGGAWSYHPVSMVAEGHTRPILLLDEGAGQAHVFATTPESGGTIVRRSAPLGTLAFDPQTTTTVVRIGADLTSNNPTSTRDSISAATGEVVLGSTANTSSSRRYVFHMAGVPTASPTPSPTPTPTPTPLPTASPSPTASPTPSPTATPTASPSPTPSPTAAPSPGVSQTLTPSGDVYVYSGNVNRNYGTDASLRVREGTTASPYTWRSYLSFDLSAVGEPLSATLRLWVTDRSRDSMAVWAVGSTYAGSSIEWAELGLTWSNAPSLTGDALANATPTTDGTWIEFDVSDALDGDDRLDLALNSNGTDSAVFSAREGSRPPELVVTTGG